MAGVKRRSMAKLCLALGLFILAGVFRQLDRSAPPLPSAVFFLDQPDLHRACHGVGIFHFASNPASRGAALSDARLRDGGAVAVSARGEIPLL